MISFDLMHWTLKRRAIQSQFDGNKETSKEPALNTSVYELKIDGLAEWNPINHFFFFVLFFAQQNAPFVRKFA